MSRAKSSGTSFQKSLRQFLSRLGPGLITGASDDDPSGIATYSQVGAQFGYGMLWTMLFSYPLMAAIQEISAWIGRVTGHGIAHILRSHYPKPLLYGLVVPLFIANTLNLGADIGAMGASTRLVLGGSSMTYVVIFALLSLALEIFIPYTTYVRYLKWMTLAVFAYVVAAFSIHLSWGAALKATFLPPFSLSSKYLTSLLAVLGTTISPYLLFWQASQEAEEVQDRANETALRDSPSQASDQFHRIRLDTYLGMGLSNAVAFFIILTAAGTLHIHGITDVHTAEQAAQALEPIAGRFSSWVFALGIVGTGLLAVPVLAGSAAFAMGEALKWRVGLERKPKNAKRFYGVLTASTLLGLGLNLFHINPIKALYWTSVINGAVSVPIMAVMMLMTTRMDIMGSFTLPFYLRCLGWICVGVMGAALLGMMVSF